jgi:Holliday junction resolvase
MKSIREKDLQREILSFLRKRGIFAWRQNAGAAVGDGRFVRFSIPGISDIIGILPDGRFLAVEVKLAGRKLSKNQEIFLSAIRANGGVAIVARSLIDVIEGLREGGRCGTPQR